MGNNGSPMSDQDIIKAEDIQPSEMNDGKFVPTNQKFNDGPQGPFGENDEGPHGEQATNYHGQDGPDGTDPHAAPPVDLPNARDKTESPAPEPQMKPQEAPNMAEMQKMVGGDQQAADPSPQAPAGKDPASVDFMEANTRKMMETNTDYQVPNNAFSNLWKDFLTSTQSQLGSRDPSANSRGGIERVQPIQFGPASKKSETKSNKTKKSSK